MSQLDFFVHPAGDALPPGLSYRETIIDPAEEAALLTALAGIDVSPFRFQGWTGKRQTASFGWHYDFDHARFAEAEPIPDFLRPLRDRAAGFAGLVPDDLVQALAVRYHPGAGIGWHRDRPVFEHVVGVSLGTPATLRLRRRTPGGFDRAALPLAPRSVYHLRDEVRHGWEHGIAAHDALRWSITFRSLSSRGVGTGP